MAARDFEGFGTAVVYPGERFRSFFDLHDLYADFSHRSRFIEPSGGPTATMRTSPSRPRHLGNLSARADPRELSQRGAR